MFTDSETQFTCEARNAPSFAWRVNGTFLNLLNDSLHADLDTDDKRIGDIVQNTLTILARAEYNGTVVQCVAGVVGGGSTESRNVTLMIQGN